MIDDSVIMTTVMTPIIMVILAHIHNPVIIITVDDTHYDADKNDNSNDTIQPFIVLTIAVVVIVTIMPIVLLLLLTVIVPITL